MLPWLIAGLAFALPALPADSLESLVEGLHWKRARALVDQQLPHRAADARFLWLASRVSMAFGDLSRAAAFGEQAAAIDPRNADYQVQLFEAYGSQAQDGIDRRHLCLDRAGERLVAAE